MIRLVVFTLDGLSYGLPLETVERVIHALEIRPLPDAPEIIPGIINVSGKIIPVIDLRKKFALPVKELDPENRMILADTGKRTVALIVDSVEEIIGLPAAQFDAAGDSLPFAGFIKGVAKTESGLVLIYDLGKFLNLEEEKDLENSIAKKKR